MGRRLAIPLLVLVLVGSQAAALTDEEIFRDLRFNLINPGARSLAMGGAFVSLADDATAAQANPAGLAFLRKPEYFAELRVVDNAARSSIRTESAAGINTFVATGTNIDDVVGPTFLSAVSTYNRWAMGVSLQEVLNIDNSTLSSFAFTFPDSPGVFLAEGTGSIDMTVRNLNASVGVRLTDRIGIGATMTLSQLNVDSRVVNEIVDTGGNIADQEILEPTLDLLTRINDEDDEVVYSVGFIYKQERWGAGAVYRRGPRFTVFEIIDLEEDLDGDGLIGDTEVSTDVFDIEQRFPGLWFSNRFGLPDSVGVGGHWIHFDDRFTLTANIERIRYSNLLDRYVPGINVLTSEDAVFDVDDGTDYRIGSEYLLYNENNPLPLMALRGGMFWESDTTITARFTGSEGFATEDVFKGRDRQFHGTVGVGFVLGEARYKIDVAADFADSDNEYLVSFINKGQ